MNAVTIVAARIGLLLIVACSSLLPTAQADDSVVYESLPTVTIGRVFFTPQERKRLDTLRHRKPATASRSKLSTTTMPKAVRTNDTAAGYILSSTGTSQIYANGDFVSARPGQRIQFPGDVTIGRPQTGASVRSVPAQSRLEPAHEAD